MIEKNTFLKELISLPGLSAYEFPIRDRLAQAWKPLVDEIIVSPLGSLHGLRKGKGSEPRRSILLAAHMDAIGMMVSGISKGGWLRITRIGGLDRRVLPGQQVCVHGRSDLPAVIVQPPDHLLPGKLAGKPIPIDYLLVDTGLEEESVREFVRVGDVVSFAQEPFAFAGSGKEENILAGHSMDNRASVAALTFCLEELQAINHAWDVWAVATAQEEVTLGGGFTSPFEICPDIVIAIDVTFAKDPGISDYRVFPLNKGVTLGWGANIHPAVHRAMKQVAEQLDIPHHFEVMPGHSGTDLYAMQVVAEGFPGMVLGIPLRYMHTPLEMVSLKDVARAAHLLAEFIARMEPDFMDKIQWDVDDERK